MANGYRRFIHRPQDQDRLGPKREQSNFHLSCIGLSALVGVDTFGTGTVCGSHLLNHSKLFSSDLLPVKLVYIVRFRSEISLSVRPQQRRGALGASGTVTLTGVVD